MSGSDCDNREKPGFLKRPGFCHAEFAARDFVSTGEGLFFAVVANGIEDDRVPAFLRYRHDGRQFHKLGTEAAQELLRESHPEYLYHSRMRDADLHGVPLARIERHYVPQVRVRELRERGPRDRIERIAMQFLDLLIDHGIREECLGVTGSFLIEAHGEQSDIDVVITDRHRFHKARQVIHALFEECAVVPLNEGFWHAAWLRRGGSLSLDEYARHERRKFNKLSIDGVKIDVSLALRDPEPDAEPFRKLRQVDVTVRVLDDSFAFDYPAVWVIESEVAARVVCWTPTYTGQAFAGETMCVAGWLEETAAGRRQIIVGTSRSAVGESIRVVGLTSGESL